MKIFKYKLVKIYPNSPKLGTTIEFNENQTLQYDCILADVANSPEFWRDVSNGDVEEQVDKIFRDSSYREHYNNVEWDDILNIPVCKKKIVEYIKQLLNEKISDL